MHTHVRIDSIIKFMEDLQWKVAIIALYKLLSKWKTFQIWLDLGAVQRKFQKSENTMEMGEWVQVSLGFFVGKLSQNSSKPVQIRWSSMPYVLCLYNYTLLKVVSFYDLSVLSMSVMGFQKKLDGGGWVGWALSKFLFRFLDFFNFAKPLRLR